MDVLGQQSNPLIFLVIGEFRQIIDVRRLEIGKKVAGFLVVALRTETKAGEFTQPI